MVGSAICSPRRSLRDIAATREDRKAIREQRRLEIEQELRDKLGIVDTDEQQSNGTSNANTPKHEGAAARSFPRGAESSSPRLDERGEGSSRRCAFRKRYPARESPGEHHSNQPSDGDVIGHSAHENEPGDPVGQQRPTSRGGVRCSTSSAPGNSVGPPRPPKPKPYRPLSFNEGSAAESSAPCEMASTSQRWKSALLPIWPDRQSSPCEKDSQSPNSDLNCHDEEKQHTETFDACTSVAAGKDVGQHLKSASLGSTMLTELCAVVKDDIRDSPTQIAMPTRSTNADQPAHRETPTGRSLSNSAGLSVCRHRNSHSLDSARHRQIQASGDAEHHSRNTTQTDLNDQSDRARQLEESTRRLREKAQQLRTENRRCRVLPSTRAPVDVHARSSEDFSTRALDSSDSVTQANVLEPSVSNSHSRRIEGMRRRIAELDEINAQEQERLETEQREMQERRRAQEEFERSVQEKAEKHLREHREREEQEAKRRELRELEEQQKSQERERRRLEQLQQEEEKSKRREEIRAEGRSESTQLKWQLFEEELERQWAEQELEERRRLETYAKDRLRQYDEWDRKLVSERRRFASEAEFCEARTFCKARNAANADARYYSTYRSSSQAGPAQSQSQSHRRGNTQPQSHSSGASVPNKNSIDTKGLIPEECAVLKELQSVRGAPRESQKAKVKELLFRWHPDKNPSCTEKATRVFQFIQKHRELVLSL